MPECQIVDPLCLCRVCRHARVARVDAFAQAIVARHAEEWAREEAEEWALAVQSARLREARYEAPTMRPPGVRS